MVGKVSTGGNFSKLTTYLTADADRVEWSSVRGDISMVPQVAAAQMERTSDEGKAESPVAHVIISFTKEDLQPAAALANDRLEQPPLWGSRAKAELYVDEVLSRLDLGNRQALLVAHNDRDHPHVHVMVNRYDPVAKETWSDWRSQVRIRDAVEAVERQYGLTLTGRNVPDDGKEKPVTLSRWDWEAEASGKRSFPRFVRDEAAPVLAGAQTWHRLQEGLREHGLRVERTTRGGLVSGEDGRTVSLSRVDRAFSMPRLEARLGPFPKQFRQQEVASAHSRIEPGRTPHPSTENKPPKDDTMPDAQAAAAPGAKLQDDSARHNQLAASQAATHEAQISRAADRGQKREQREARPATAEPRRESPAAPSEVGRGASATGAGQPYPTPSQVKGPAPPPYPMPQAEAGKSTPPNGQATEAGGKRGATPPTPVQEVPGARSMPMEQRTAEAREAIQQRKPTAEIDQALAKYGLKREEVNGGSRIVELPRPQAQSVDPQRAGQQTTQDRGAQPRDERPPVNREVAESRERGGQGAAIPPTPTRESSTQSGADPNTTRAPKQEAGREGGGGQRAASEDSRESRPVTLTGETPAQNKKAQPEAKESPKPVSVPTSPAKHDEPSLGKAATPSKDAVPGKDDNRAPSASPGGSQLSGKVGVVTKHASDLSRVSEQEGDKAKAYAALPRAALAGIDAAVEAGHSANKAIKKGAELVKADGKDKVSPGAQLRTDAERSAKDHVAVNRMEQLPHQVNHFKAEIAQAKQDMQDGKQYRTSFERSLGQAYKSPDKAEQAFRQIAAKSGPEAAKGAVLDKPESLGPLKESSLRPGNLFKDRTQEARIASSYVGTTGARLMAYEKSDPAGRLEGAQQGLKKAQAQIVEGRAAISRTGPEVRMALGDQYRSLPAKEQAVFKAGASSPARAVVALGVAEKKIAHGADPALSVHKAARALAGPPEVGSEAAKGFAKLAPGKADVVKSMTNVAPLSTAGVAAKAISKGHEVAKKSVATSIER